MEYRLKLEVLDLYKFSVALGERFGNYIVFLGDCYVLYCDKILNEQELQEFVENYREVESASQENI